MFIVTTFFADLVSYWLTNLYDGGNIGEVIMVIFSAIFVNQNFFWFVSIGLFAKYILVAVIHPGNRSRSS